MSLCPRCAQLWDVDTDAVPALPLSDGPSVAIPAEVAPMASEPVAVDLAAVKAKIRATDAVLRAQAAQEPDSPPRQEYLAARRAQRDGMGIGDYPDRSRAHGAARRQMPSRGREARRLEKRRERARKRGQDVALTPREKQVFEKALAKLGGSVSAAAQAALKLGQGE